MKTIHYILLAYLALLTAAGCTEQRDLFIESSPMVLVKSDWAASNIQPEDGSTIMMFNGAASTRNLVPNAIKQLMRVNKGIYDILIFNGLMYSKSETHLDYIHYRGVDNIETFEAYVTEMESKSVFRAAPNESVVNNPDILATRSIRNIEITEATKYEMKYSNGKDCHPSITDYIEDSIFFTPCRVTHTCQVKVHVSNSGSIRTARGSLKGFTNSVFLASRLPSHGFVTHQFTLNSLTVDQSDPTAGIISSPAFNTFGPPLDLPGRKYELSLTFLLVNDEEAGPYTFDITDQVEQAILLLNIDRLNNIPITETILIKIGDIKLPKVNPGGMNVGVNDWGNNIIVPAPF